MPRWNCCNRIYIKYQTSLYNYSLCRHWHPVLQFFLYKYQALFQARYLYHVLITSLCLFFVMHTNHNIRHYSFTETYGTEIKDYSWALVIIHRKTILYTWVRQRSNENLANWFNHLAFFHSMNSPTPLFITELNTHKTSVPWTSCFGAEHDVWILTPRI